MIEMTEYAETTVYSDLDMILSLVAPFFILSDDVTTSFVHARKTNIPEDCRVHDVAAWGIEWGA